MIISVHIPRTAGSSFRAYLRANSNINLMEDYGNPIMVPSVIRNGFASYGYVKQLFRPIPKNIDCLHGHFLPFKYKRSKDQQNVKFITWLRDPAQRIRSQYDYCFQSDKRVDKSPFQNKVAKEKWSFEAFFTDSRMQNLYSKFLWRFPINLFDFVGIVEYYEEDFKYFAEHYFNDFEPKYIYGNRTSPVEIDESTREKIMRINAPDYKIYETGLSMKKRRATPVNAKQL